MPDSLGPWELFVGGWVARFATWLHDTELKLRAGLEKSGLLTGAYDLLIAAHALALGLTLVTNHVREFPRVPGLSLENWAD